MIVESSLTGGHVPEDIVNDGNAFKTVLIVYCRFVLQVTVLFQGLFIPVLFHPLHCDVVLGFEALLRELFFQFFDDMVRLKLLLDLLSLLIVTFFEV